MVGGMSAEGSSASTFWSPEEGCHWVGRQTETRRRAVEASHHPRGGSATHRMHVVTNRGRSGYQRCRQLLCLLRRQARPVLVRAVFAQLLDQIPGFWAGLRAITRHTREDIAAGTDTRLVSSRCCSANASKLPVRPATHTRGGAPFSPSRNECCGSHHAQRRMRLCPSSRDSPPNRYLGERVCELCHPLHHHGEGEGALTPHALRHESDHLLRHLSCCQISAGALRPSPPQCHHLRSLALFFGLAQHLLVLGLQHPQL